MPAYANEIELRNDVSHLLNEQFGPEDVPGELDEILDKMLIYHDVRQAIFDQTALRELQTIAGSADNQAELTAQLSELHQRVEGLRTVAYVAVDENPDELIPRVAEASFLDGQETVRLQELVKTYRAALEKVDKEAIDLPDMDQAILRSVTPDLAALYVEQLFSSPGWLEPNKALFPLDQLATLIEQNDLNALLPQTWVRLLFDEEHYRKAIVRFERLQQPYLADVARLFLAYARFMHSSFAGETNLAAGADEIRQVLDRLDQSSSTETAMLGELQLFEAMIRATMRMSLGLLPAIPVKERIEHLEKAERTFDAMDNSVFRALSPMMTWSRAQLLQGRERDNLELAAFSRVNVLLAQSALEKEPLQRLSSMTILAGLPADWKFSKGDFMGAIEQATMAKSFASMTIETMRGEMRPMLEEIQKAIGDTSTSPEEAAQVAQFRDTLMGIVESSQVMLQAQDLLIFSCRAKLAEADGDFGQAYEWYQKATLFEQQVLAQVRTMLESLFRIAESSRLLQQGFQHEARAAYFHGMALLNRGDQQLIETDYVTANQSYLEAKVAFQSAADLWWQEAERLPDAQPDVRQQPRQQQKTNEMRVRYCDAKVEVAAGEQFSALSQAWQAAKRFERAASIFEELVAGLVLQEEGRNLEVLQASADFCRGRYLLEMDRDARRQDNVQEGRTLLDRAALHFEQVNELRWARYIHALRLEYEAVILETVARSTPSPEAAAFLQQAQSKAYDAASIYRQLGVEKRARLLDTWARTVAAQPTYAFVVVGLPKPLDPIGSQANPAQQLVNQYQVNPKLEDKMEDELRALQARAIALDRRLDDLKDRRDRGRIDEGRYTDMALDLDRERIEILLKVQSIVKGQDEDIDSIVQDAINGEKETALIDRLQDVAQKKGLGQRIIDGLQKHKGTIVSWLIEVGFQLTKRATTG